MAKLEQNGHSLPWWKRQTLMSRLDDLAQQDPNHIYGEYPSSPLTYDDGFRKVSIGQLANAVNGIAWLLERELGADCTNETLAYIGSNDVRYTAVILGAAKAGHKALLISPRNSVAAQFHLFKTTGCKTVLSPSPRPPPITAILEAQQVRCIDVPSVDDLLTTQHPVFPYTKSLDEAKNDAFCAAHTSGSTGMPKPLVWSHQFVSANIQHGQLPPPPGYESQGRWIQGSRVFVTFPPFHGAAIACNIFEALAHGTTIVAPTSGAIATGNGLVEALKHTSIDVAFLVPSIVLDLAQNPEALDVVSKHVKRILYCGGDLPQVIGDVVADKMPIHNQYGASEQGLTPQIWGNRAKSDWKYIQPHPGIGAVLQYSNDDLYEYTLVRQPEGVEQPAVFSLFPELDAYPSRDLYRCHPTNPDLWSWQARVDDVIVFLNGEKTNPISMEQYISTKNADVARALVVGSQRFQAALMIQPVDTSRQLDSAERAAFIERIWPSVEEANKVCPAHAKIAKSHIMFTMPEKPMVITGKGTIQRAGTVAMYENELEQLYIDADAAVASDSDGVGQVSNIDDVNAVMDFIKQVIIQATSIRSLSPEDNFFTLGMDSLQALLTLRRLRHGLSLPNLALTTLYTNPSITMLAQAVRKEAQNIPHDTGMEQRIQEAQALIDKFRTVIDQIPIRASEETKAGDNVSVVLTGSTGSLGCHLLDSLLSNPSISAVHCFNRAADGGKALQVARLESRGLSSALAADPRLFFHSVDLSKPDLGLEAAELAHVRNSVTHIIHAAWPVDFNMPLAAFEPHLYGLVNLATFVAGSPHTVRYMFVSSISSTLTDRPGPVPEAVIKDLSFLNPTGYGQSKLVGEILLAHASERLPKTNVEFAFTRVGQLAGVTKESVGSNVVTWKAAEWFPSLVISSAHVGALPSSLGVLDVVDWVPIDVLAQVLTELTITSSDSVSPQLAVFQPDNLSAKAWKDLQGAVISEVQAITGQVLDVVAPEAWIDMVQKSMESSAEESGVGMAKAMNDGALAKLLKLNPAVKLLDMFKFTLTGKLARPRESQMAANTSPTLKSLGSIQDAWMKKWTREWLQSVGYA